MEDDIYVQDIDCNEGFMGIYTMYQIVHFKYVQFIVCQVYLRNIVFLFKGYATQGHGLFSQAF